MEASLWIQMKTTLLSTHHILSPLDQGNIVPTGCSGDNLQPTWKPSFRGDGWKQEAHFPNELSRALAAVTRLTSSTKPRDKLQYSTRANTPHNRTARWEYRSRHTMWYNTFTEPTYHNQQISETASGGWCGHEIVHMAVGKCMCTRWGQKKMKGGHLTYIYTKHMHTQSK